MTSKTKTANKGARKTSKGAKIEATTLAPVGVSLAFLTDAVNAAINPIDAALTLALSTLVAETDSETPAALPEAVEMTSGETVTLTGDDAQQQAPLSAEDAQTLIVNALTARRAHALTLGEAGDADILKQAQTLAGYINTHSSPNYTAQLAIVMPLGFDARSYARNLSNNKGEGDSSLFIGTKVINRIRMLTAALANDTPSFLDSCQRGIYPNLFKHLALSIREVRSSICASVDNPDGVRALRRYVKLGVSTADAQASSVRQVLHHMGIAQISKGKRNDEMQVTVNGLSQRIAGWYEAK